MMDRERHLGTGHFQLSNSSRWPGRHVFHHHGLSAADVDSILPSVKIHRGSH